MRSWVALLFWAATLWGQSSTPEDLCSIEGAVVNAVTGIPVKKAAVAFLGESAGKPVNYTTVTDALGRYQAQRVEPGKYVVMAEANGFERVRGATVVLSKGQKSTGVDLKLQPFGVVTGRILNSDNEPMSSVRVSLYRTKYRNGHKLLAGAATTETNDLGEYRFTELRPGRYYLRADSSDPFGTGEDRSEQPPKTGYVPEYYPGTTDSNASAPIEIAPGSMVDTGGMRMERVPVTLVRGHVANPAGYTGGPLSVSLVADSNHAVNFDGYTRASRDGNFEIAGVPPGGYLLEAQMHSRDTAYYAKRVVQVGADPLEHVVLLLAPALTVSGKVRFDGEGTLNLRKLMIVLDSAARASFYIEPAKSDDDGNFTISGIKPDRYFVSVAGLPAGYYVKAIRMRERDVLENGADFTVPAGQPIEIAIGSNGGKVSGAVKDAKDVPASGARVVLIPEPEPRREQPSWYKMVGSDPAGKFSMTGLAPGEYRLFAWDNVQDGAWMNADFLKPIESQGKRVMVADGSTAAVDLIVIRE